jgi:hypothetical protein
MVKRLEVIPTGNDFLALERGELDGQVAGPPRVPPGAALSIRPRPSRTTMSVSARPSPTRSTAMTWSSGILLGRGIVGPSGGLVPSNP